MSSFALRGLFVTGTDTGVGKTIVTAAIAAALRREGRSVGVWKPVQSGAAIGSGETDAELLLRGSGIDERPETIAPYSFEAPLAPVSAARLQGVALTLDALREAGAPLVGRYDALLVEGAGGVAAPLTDDCLVADFIAMLGLPALIVARAGLGTVNHTLLTAALLRQRGIPIVGVILNDGEAVHVDDPSVDGNAHMIERYGKLRVLGRFPMVESEGFEPRKLAETAFRTLDMNALQGCIFETDTREDDLR